MASKSAYQSTEKGAEIEEALDQLEKVLERLRAMYEQYFLGISRMAPSQLHGDAERKVRDLTQIQIKNTALRYRYATLSQKFSAYNSYWKRTMRMIEQGRYVRDLQRVKRQADKTGEEIPEEILAAMPKMMRERVRRDRENVAKVAEMQGRVPILDETIDESAPETPPVLSGSARTAGNIHRLDDALVPEDVDLDEMFATLTRDAEAAIDASPAMVRSSPPRRDTLPPPMSHDFDPPTERAAMPPEHVEAPRRKTGPTTPPLRPPVMRSSSPAIPLPRPTPPPVPGEPARPPATPPPIPGRVATAASPPRAATAPASGRITPPTGNAVPRPGAPAARSGPAARPGAPDARSALGPPPGMSDADTRTLYNRYLKARELCGESNDGVTYDKLLRTLRSQSSRIMTDHQARGVEFGVVIKDNKVVLKAKPKL